VWFARWDDSGHGGTSIPSRSRGCVAALSGTAFTDVRDPQVQAIAWSVSDLAGQTRPTATDVDEAVALRSHWSAR
jgi:hypothetical protein